jgi:hypothetical protein
MAEWNQCWYCGVTCNTPRGMGDGPLARTVDHLIPQHQGGGPMVTACKGCNNLKGESSLEDFRSYLDGITFHGEKMGWIPW